MKPLVADTFYWISLTNPEDATHEQATVFAAFAQRSAIVTAEEVLAEFLTFFSGRGSFWRAKAVSITRSILANTSVRVPPDPRDVPDRP